MHCCANCFGDRQLRRVIEAKHTHQGDCGYCHSVDVALIDPLELQDLFLSLLGIYTRAADGKQLVRWFRDDWTMFSHENMDDAHAKELLGEILDDGNLVRHLFKPVEGGSSPSLDLWDDFREELLKENRFFQENKPDLSRLRELFNSLIADEADLCGKFFRARICEADVVFPASEMWAPPASRSRHGRANPAGIPYLYLASDLRTVVAEVRPQQGQCISVARFELPTKSRVLDLRNPKKTISPFLFADEQEIARLRGDISFLERLGDELSRPVLKGSAHVDYLPSQYLCEYAKHCGFDGVFYGSSASEGFNLAVFHPSTASIDKKVSKYYADKVTVSIEQR